MSAAKRTGWIETPYGRRMIAEDTPRPTESPDQRQAELEAVAEKTARRITGKHAAIEEPKRIGLRTWAAVISAGVVVLGALITGVTFVYSIKGEVSETKAAIAPAVSREVAPIDRRVTVLEANTGTHTKAQAERERRLDDNLDALQAAVQTLNINIITIGERQEIRGLRRIPSQRGVKDTKS